jgi:hypothetical protein
MIRQTGVTRTPEVVVLDAKRKLRYRGRIDDQVRTGGTRPDVQSDDLKQALDDLLAGHLEKAFSERHGVDLNGHRAAKARLADLDASRIPAASSSTQQAPGGTRVVHRQLDFGFLRTLRHRLGYCERSPSW